jgi:hypothetical protein
MAHIEETGIVPHNDFTSFQNVWRDLFSRRSMGNILNHWHFVALYSPLQYRFRIQASLLASAMSHLFLRTPARFFAYPVYRMSLLMYKFIVYWLRQLRSCLLLPWLIRRLGFDLIFNPMLLPSSIRLPIYICACPGIVLNSDLANSSIPLTLLLDRGILRPLTVEGWFVFSGLKRVDLLHYPSLAWLFLRSWNPPIKLWRAFHYVFTLRKQ